MNPRERTREFLFTFMSDLCLCSYGGRRFATIMAGWLAVTSLSHFA